MKKLIMMLALGMVSQGLESKVKKLNIGDVVNNPRTYLNMLDEDFNELKFTPRVAFKSLTHQLNYLWRRDYPNYDYTQLGLFCNRTLRINETKSDSQWNYSVERSTKFTTLGACVFTAAAVGFHFGGIKFLSSLFTQS